MTRLDINARFDLFALLCYACYKHMCQLDTMVAKRSVTSERKIELDA